MPGLDDNAWTALLLNERDAFKLAIRGCASIEDDMNSYTEDLFRAPMPGGMNGLGPFSKRLPVAAAFGVVERSLIAPMRVLWKLRNDFAHGQIADLTAERARELTQAYVQAGLLDNATRAVLNGRPPLYHLVYALSVTRSGIRAAHDFLVGERNDQQRANAVRAAITARLTELGQNQPADGG